MEDYRLELADGVATLTFTRPHRANAYHMRMGDPLRRAFVDLRYNKDIRCLVIRSEGKHFMAGGDLEVVTSLEGKSPSELTDVGEGSISDYNRMLYAMMQLEIPVIASIRGAVVGVAVGWVAACDLVIASDTTFFQAAHVASGGSSDGLTSYFLPRQIGLRKALELTLLGDRVDATEAKRLDLINFLCPDHELEQQTDALVQRFKSGPTRAYAKVKQLIYGSLDASFDEQARAEAEGYQTMLYTEDLHEGITAFFEKRAPKFKGR